MASINASTSGGGGIITTADATGNLDIQSGGSTVVAVTSAGVAVTGTLSATGASTFTGTGKFATTIGVGNATPSASGSGITFPATQSASSDANTLDDYEEGTFTPTLGASTNPTGVTYTNQIGFYRKIGSFVHVTGFISFTTYTGGSGNLIVNGIPFSPNVSVNWGTAMTEFIDYPVGKTFVATIAGTGASSMQLIFGGDNVSYDGGAIGTVAPSSGTVKYVTFGLSYFTS